MISAQKNATAAQVEFSSAKEKFATGLSKEAIEHSAKASGNFIFSLKGRYRKGGVFEEKEELFSKEELSNILDQNLSHFMKGGNRKVARERVFANAINHTLFELTQVEVLDEGLVIQADEEVFDLKTLDLLDLLERRRQSKTLINQMTLREVVGRFFQTVDNRNTQKVRDTKLVPLAKLGLVTIDFVNGEGYAVRAGPVLVSTVREAVEKFYIQYDL